MVRGDERNHQSDDQSQRKEDQAVRDEVVGGDVVGE